MLVGMNEPGEALEQFEATLKKEPRRFRAIYGAAHAAQLVGSPDTSQRYFRELKEECANADKSARPELKEARAALAKQRS